MLKHFPTVLAAAGLALALGATGAAAQMDKVRVGVIYVGPTNDQGWSEGHFHGFEAVKAELGDKVELTHVENVSEGPDAERVITQLAQGHDIVFTTSFGFMNPTVKVAERFANVKFEHATGFKSAPNLSTYSARFYEGRHVIGLIAGKMTKTNTVGYIASFPIPEVVRGINSAYLAARSVNPDIKFKIVWVSTWFDPGKEADAAKVLIDQGADILMQHTDSPAPIKLAEENGIYAFGQAQDMGQYGPKSHLTAIVDNWAPHYLRRIKAVLDGTWATADTWGGINTGMVVMAPFNDALPDDVKEMAAKARDAIAAGTLHPFTGPINKQDGSPWLSAGQTAPDGDLLGMNFYVEGIEGSIPK
jgi:simple sugar transport system substrate-binding protein